MRKPKRIAIVRLRGRQAGRVLGDLETEIMEVVWRRGPTSIREVWDDVRPKRPVAFNTVMTVMNRLVAKALLRRDDHRGSYRYRARVSRQDFVARVSHDVAETLIREFGEIAMAQFLDVLEDVDPEKLSALERLIRERQRRR